MMKMKPWMDWLRDTIWMERAMCLRCGRFSGDSVLCAVCEEKLEQLRLRDCCPRCGRPLKEGTDCGCQLPEGMLGRSVWPHDSPAGELVHTLKFQQVRDAAVPLGKGMASVLRELSLPPEACVTWITMPEQRKKERVFDHAQLLAEQIARSLDLPCVKLLQRPYEVRHQLGLTGEERRKNLKGTFLCTETLMGTYILVDDVYTTGSTLITAAETLLDSGASQVIAVTATRALKK